MATDNKYDRQLRLWGKEGQLRLASANVCVLGAGPTATETLKNLVLPGLGKFTVVDGGVVGAADLGNNFFVSQESLGRPRAEVVRDLLVEMNPNDCQGAAKVCDPAQLVAQEPDFLLGFSLVIATQLDPQPLLALAELCWARGLPLLSARCWGYLGSLRLQLRGHEVVESKPDTQLHDLRLARPFPELEQLADSYDLASMDDRDFAHTPYVIFLIKAMAAWRADHGGQPPKTFAEKNAFKKSVELLDRPSKEGRRENMKEALENAYRAYASVEVPEDVASIVEAARQKSLLGADCSDFQVLAKALAEFMDEEGQGLLPLKGSIPDMEADNPKYMALQRAYETRAAYDAQRITQRAQALLAGLPTEAEGGAAAAARPVRVLDPEVARNFCRNAWDLKAVTTRTLGEEWAAPLVDPDSVFDSGREELTAQAPLLWFLALRGAEKFQASEGRWPGADPKADEDSVRADGESVWAETQKVLASAAGSPTVEQLNEAYAHEVARFGASQEVHATAAVLGGACSQEAVKVITHQWVPANNTFVFNGVAGTGGTFEF